MNCNIYLYGEFDKGYTQYPDNYTRSIIKGVISKIKNQGKCQVAIYRNGDLAYLIYNYKYSSNKYFGFCLEFNKVCPHNISYLFKFFDSLIADILNKGTLLHYTTDGTILPGSSYLYEQSAIVDYYSNFIHLHLDDKHAQFKKLPPINRSVDNDKNALVHIQDLNWSVESTLNRYNTIIILKDAEDNSIYRYKSVLSRINETNLSLRKENKELQERNQEILRQKKQFRNVILLILIVIGCIIGIYFLNDNLNNTQGKLDVANNTIVKKNNRINNLNNSIESLQKEYNVEHNRRVEVEERLTEVSSFFPFVVTSCNVSSEEFSFDYYAEKEKDVTVTLKAINEKSSEIVSNSHSITVSEGTGSMKLYFDYKLSGSDYYYVVLIYDGHIIAGKYW